MDRGPSFDPQPFSAFMLRRAGLSTVRPQRGIDDAATPSTFTHPNGPHEAAQRRGETDMAFIQHYDKAASALAHAEAHAFQATRSLSADEAAQFAQIASVEALIAQVHATLALAQATMKSSSPPREAAVESQLYADLQDGTPPFPVTIGGERKS